jgi:hypothetical protein
MCSRSLRLCIFMRKFGFYPRWILEQWPPNFCELSNFFPHNLQSKVSLTAAEGTSSVVCRQGFTWVIASCLVTLGTVGLALLRPSLKPFEMTLVTLLIRYKVLSEFAAVVAVAAAESWVMLSDCFSRSRINKPDVSATSPLILQPLFRLDR